MPNEADTCRTMITPKLQAAGWDTDPHVLAEQRLITHGRIIPLGQRYKRKAPKKADYLLCYRRDRVLAVVEAKASDNPAASGLQQAKDYAAMLDLKFAYATNGSDIIEFDYTTGLETRISAFPTPEALWRRYCAAAGIASPEAEDRVLAPYNLTLDKPPRYYQDIAINRAIEEILKGRQRLLLTMATGTGKTVTAFQICWKLWSTRWNRKGEHRKPKILFLADRNILVDDPMSKTFAPLQDAIHKIGDGPVSLGREMYFGIYQALAEDVRRDGLFRQFPADFFDLIVVDECHRGSARADSSWRVILDYFASAVKLGLTATPRQDDDNREDETYSYFGNPIYTYSLRQGIDDGFLAPYRVHRVVSEWDAAGWRPTQALVDRFGRQVPDDEYQTRDFERVVALRARTEAIAKHLSAFMAKTDRFAKTIVFCVDQEHALEMATALGNANADLRKSNPNFVCRVTADEGDIGRGHLAKFQDVEVAADAPIILTSSQMLTTGVDAPTVKNVVLARVVGSMSEFKQIIGRGTRVRDDYDKLWFNIIDYTGTATQKFADPAFDGDPVREDVTDIEDPVEVPEPPPPQDGADAPEDGPGEIIEPPIDEPRKFYVDDGEVRIVLHQVQDLDPDGNVLRTTRYEDYAAGRIRILCPTVFDLKAKWADPLQRSDIIQRLKDEGVEFDAMAEALQQPDADPFDLLCHLAFNAPLRTRRERARMLKSRRKDFFESHGPKARQILSDLLDKYAEHGDAQFMLPEVLHVAPISTYGTVSEIAREFGGPENLRAAVTELQNLLYQETA